MQTIPNDDNTFSRQFEGAVILENNKRKKIAKGFLNYAGIAVGAFLLFVVVVVMTTDVKLTSFMDVAALSLAFFILLFCSYAMYVNCADSGMRAGLVSDTYQSVLGKYETIKRSIIERKMQVRLPEFCRWYIADELRNTRNNLLADVGVLYEVYQEKYIGKDRKTIMALSTLSKTQKEAIIKANSISPIKLTPEMIFKRGRGSHHRSPLGTKPETKKRIAFGVKFVRTCVTSLLMGVIVLDMVVTPTWAMFAAVLLKLLTVILNGFFGYKFGFENIVIDTVNYMSDQIDLMEQMLQYVEAHPVPALLVPEVQKNNDVSPCPIIE